MEQVEIKKISATDIDTLQQIGRETFVETFAAANTEENMRYYLAEGFSRQKLMTELNDANAMFYFALLGSKAIGYLKINTGSSQTELQDDAALEIERIYVLKQFHGHKVGQLLFEKAMQLARQQRASYVWLGVWEHNERAISFYEKNGFTAFGRHVFKLGEDEQTDIMMKRFIV